MCVYIQIPTYWWGKMFSMYWWFLDLNLLLHFSLFPSFSPDFLFIYLVLRVKKKIGVNTTLQWRTVKCTWGTERWRNRLGGWDLLLPLHIYWVWEKHVMCMGRAKTGRERNNPPEISYIYACLWAKGLLGTGVVCGAALGEGNTKHWETAYLLEWAKRSWWDISISLCLKGQIT